MARTIYRIRMFTAAAAALTALVLPAAASAGSLEDAAPSCDSQVLGQTFLPWADVANYTLNPGGSFEDGAAGWRLDGASVSDGNEPFAGGGAPPPPARGQPPRRTARGAPHLGGGRHPDIRFFTAASNPMARLSVEVLFEGPSGELLSAPIGTVSGAGRWAPTAPFPIVANLLALLPDNHTAVAFRFIASGGDFRIDDLYVDPYQRR